MSWRRFGAVRSAGTCETRSLPAEKAVESEQTSNRAGRRLAARRGEQESRHAQE